MTGGFNLRLQDLTLELQQ